MEFHIGITNLIYNLCRFLGKEREDGEILFLGRRDFQVKHMGYRIELGEIEAAALRESAISNACVLYRKQEKKIVLIYERAQELPARCCGQTSRRSCRNTCCRRSSSRCSPCRAIPMARSTGTSWRNGSAAHQM